MDLENGFHMSQDIYRTMPELFAGKRSACLNRPGQIFSTGDCGGADLKRTKTRFVVNVDHQNPDDRIMQAKPGLTIPEKIDLRTVTKVYISATGGHSARKNPHRDRLGSPGPGPPGSVFFEASKEHTPFFVTPMLSQGN